jgi:putative ABC transport system permease protein
MSPSTVGRVRSRVRAVDLLATGTIGLRTRRGRTVLTALGIAIGIAAMVATIGISASSRADLIDRLDRLGTNLLSVTPGQSMLGDDAELPADAPAMIRRIGPVQDAAALVNVEASVYRNDLVNRNQTGGLSVKGADTNLASTLGATLQSGTFLNEATAGYPTVVLGAKAARQLGITSADAGVQVQIGREWFTVVGILDPVELVPAIDEAALIGRPMAEARFGQNGAPSTVYVRTNPERVDAVRTVLAATANPQSPEQVKVERPSDALAARTLANQTLTTLLLGLGAVALLVGGIGIANVMVIGVLERRAEIGVRRALGAMRRHILGQFVIEAMVLSAIGGCVGVVLGSIITAVYARSSGWRLDLPLSGLIGGVLGALLVGAIAGLHPASRAARLAPADAVRPR